ncbi:protein NYNRIN-like [Mya arenaria]|uniref:protein NYNRIN-like n=1 Tax=Mya arenaria TaxID=6604 RepID=UPI0022E57893|nr:protein NYNRIN-like [Mya arenaria]
MGHCDALSRCDTPKDCSCPEVDMMEPLKCGPCQKCLRRSELMTLRSRLGEELSSDIQGTKHTPNEDQTDVAVRAASNPDDQEPSTSKGIVKQPRYGEGHTLLWAAALSNEDVVAKQMEDGHIKSILEAKLEGRKPLQSEMLTASQETRHYWLIWDNLEIHSGVLYRRFIRKDGNGQMLQLIAPHSIRAEVVKQAHDVLTAGHMGMKRTKHRILQSYYWFCLKSDVSLHVKGCDICESDKKPPNPPRAPLGHIGVGAPMDVLALDYAGPFPVTERKNRYVLVVTDLFSKYVEVVAVPNQTAETCASVLLNTVVSRWGVPLALHSDQGLLSKANL